MLITGASQDIKSRKGGKAWSLNQSAKEPKKVIAAKKAIAGMISKPVIKKKTQVQSLIKTTI